MSAVTVVYPNNRRVQVKLDGNAKTLFQILDEACKKQGLNVDKYGLKHHNRVVDLSLSFRMSGLPNNCTLEMVETEKPQKSKQEDVQVALQLPDGQRLISTVPADATLLDVLLDFEKTSNSKLVEPDGENLQPVCEYLNNEYIGYLALAATTLKSLGVSKKALFRYAPRQIDPVKLKEINESIEKSQSKMRKLEATYEKKVQENMELDREEEGRRRQESEALEQLRNQQIIVTENQATATAGSSLTQGASVAPKEPKRSNDATARQARLDTLQSMLSMVDRSIADGTDLPWDAATVQPLPLPHLEFANFKFPEATKGMDLRSQGNAIEHGSSAVPEVEPCDRRAVVYSMTDLEDVALEEPSVEMFDVTTSDVQNMFREAREESEARVLLPESYIRQKDFERKIQSWKVTVIRVRMPDRMVLQGVFRTLETVAALYRFVEENLHDPNLPFELCLPPNVVVDKADGRKTLLQAGLSPAATLIYKQKQQYPVSLDGFLSAQLRSNLKTALEAELVAEESLQQNEKYVPYRPPVATAGNPQQQASSSSDVPKWMASKSGSKKK